MEIVQETTNELQACEAELSKLIASKKYLSIQFTGGFESALYEGLGATPKGHFLRSWYLDDFQFDSVKEYTSKITLNGRASWLTGGGDCNVVQLDVAADTDRLLYSFKFHKKPGQRQLLYVGRTYTGWNVRHV